MSDPIVLFCGGLAGDGVARNTVHLANALTQRGARVTVICLKGGPLAADLRGAEVACLGWREGPRGLALAAAVPALRRGLGSAKPAVVVSMGNHAHLAAWAALRGLPDTPRIYRISNDPAHGGASGAGVRGLGLGLVARDATKLVCVSAAIAARKPFRRARRDRRVHILPNGVDLHAVRAHAAHPVDHPWLEGAPFLVAVGRLHRQKNYEALIDALAVARAGGHPDLRLLVLGAGPRAWRATLETRARAHGLSDAVRLEGELANPFPLMSRAAAYVLPSLWEGASNSLLEALACGVPVVASRTAGNACEVLGAGRFGALADPRDPGDLARAILAQLDPARRIRPADRAADFALGAVTDRLCGIVLAARSAHDEIQMQAAGGGHLQPLSSPLRGRNNTEY
ncbi:glycosyltransferase [uncultured Phenylobacterium sp.]|uniref:glycosyltransferase n=1 Tax=uncultured Phenylobacterium sp. TaxID=349273 RepID=UPI0025DABB50|nr:glycosyltransferase [uncultured Phenylobacterium sp.]